jgi:preprotein translocase subunit SecE
MTNKAKDKRLATENTDEPSPYSPAQIRKFVDEVKVEFGKIVWPDKKMTLGLTGIVIVMTIIVSIYLGSVDLVIGRIVSGFLQ